MGYGNGMAGSKKMIRKPAIRTKMYSKEFATFYTNAISTSGDGIFPLLAKNRKDGFIVSGVGLFIALVVGYIALFLGF